MLQAMQRFYVSLLQIIYSTVLYFLVMFLVPLVSLVILNYKLMAALRRTRRKRDTWRLGNSSHGNAGRLSSAAANEQTGPSVNNSSRSEDDITRMLIVVVLVFVISQTPALITQAFIPLIADEVAAMETCRHPFFFFYVRLSDLFVVANSSLNFIVYSFCSRRFRQILFSLISCGHTSDLVTAPDTRSHVTQNRRPIQGQEQTTGRPCTVRMASLPINAMQLTNQQALTPAPTVESVDAQLVTSTEIASFNLCFNKDEASQTAHNWSSPVTINDIQ